MHPRVTMHSLVFEADTPLDAMLQGFRDGGADRIGVMGGALTDAGWDPAIRTIAGSGLDVTHLVHARGPLFELEREATWDEARARVIATADAAVALGARCAYGVTGPAMSLTWEVAAERFGAAVAPVAAHARDLGLPLLIEATNLRSAHIGFVHTFRDAVDLALETGVGVCLDVLHCWTERGLSESLRRADGLLGLVQLADWVAAEDRPRAVPGDGDLPLERLVAAILDSGYTGFFDIEIHTEPGVEPARTVTRATAYVSGLLDRLGA